MDLDKLIAQITEEVCARIQANNPPPFTEPRTTNLSAHIEYTFSSPAVTTDDVRRMCETAKNKKLAAVCVPQWLVAFAKEQLFGSDVKVSTPVGLPGGMSATAAKYAEVKEAVKNGADEVDIPVNMELLTNGDYDAVRKDLEEAMMPAKGHICVKAVVESGAGPQQLAAAVDIAKKSGANFLAVSAITNQSLHDPIQVKELAGLCQGSVKLKLSGHIRDYSGASALVAAGGYRIGTSAAGALV
jgi:deoxyribose-phosphate aldolase